MELRDNSEKPDREIPSGKQPWEPLRVTCLGDFRQLLQSTPGKTVLAADGTDTRKGHGSN